MYIYNELRKGRKVNKMHCFIDGSFFRVDVFNASNLQFV